MKNNDKLICLIGKFTLLLQRQTLKTKYYEEKLFVSPLLPMDWIGDSRRFFCGSMRWSKYGFFHPDASPL